MKFFSDAGQTLENIANRYIEGRKEFAHLQDVKIKYCWYYPIKIEKSGRGMLGQAMKVGQPWRDLFGYDFLITILKDLEDPGNKTELKRVVYHELKHCNIKQDEDTGEIKYDKEGRIVTLINPHDIIIEDFVDVIKQFGLPSTTKDTITAVLEKDRVSKKTAKKSKKKKSKK